jgi:hypothetical protein
MRKAWIVLLALAIVLSQTVAAQDAKTVIGNASKAMGVEGLNSIYYYGVAQNGNLGQNNNSNQPWPMAGANDYARAISFGPPPASRATWVNYGAPVTGGAATQTPGQQNITGQSPWAQAVEIYITPLGIPEGRSVWHGDGQDADHRWQALPGGQRHWYREVAERPALQSGRLHQ